MAITESAVVARTVAAIYRDGARIAESVHSDELMFVRLFVGKPEEKRTRSEISAARNDIFCGGGVCFGSLWNVAR